MAVFIDSTRNVLIQDVRDVSNMPVITCKKCGHNWMSRVANPVKCPVCGFPTGLKIPANIREGMNLPPMPTMPITPDMPQRLDFPPRLDIPSARFATLDDKEWEKLEKEAIEDYKDWLKKTRASHKERQRQHIVELAGRIIERGRPVSYMWRVESIPDMITKVGNIRRTNLVESKSDEARDKLKSLESWNKETELEKKLEETATARHRHPEIAPKEEDFIKELEEDEQIVKLAIPIFQEIVAVYDARIEELKKAEEYVAPLVKDANDIRNEALKLVEEETKLIDKLCEADSFGRHKELDKLLPSFRDLTSKINKMEDEHKEIISKIYQLRIDPPNLLSFPSRNLVKLRFHDRIRR